MITSPLHILPSEILDDIFSYLDYNDVLQCQLTCKRWSGQATQRILYKNVASLIRHKRLDCFVRTITISTSHPGRFVKFLDLSSLFSRQYITRDILNILGEFCPNVERILGYDTNDMFWESITTGRQLGHWAYITELPSPSFKHGFTPEIYFDTVLACSNSLEVLEFYFHGYVGSTVLAKTDCVVKRLKPDFYRLLKIQFNEVHGTKKGITQFDHIIDQCPRSVQSLSFNKYYDNFGFQHNARQNHRTLNTLDPARILPCYSIKHLTVKSCNFSDESIQYLLQKFPNFEAIDIFYSWGGFLLLSKPVILDFFQYVSSIPIFNISGITNTGNGEGICKLVALFIYSTTMSKDPIFINADIACHYDNDLNSNNVISSLKITNTKIPPNEQRDNKNENKKESTTDIQLRFHSHYANMIRSQSIMNQCIWKKCGSRLQKLCLSPNVRIFEGTWSSYHINKEGLDIVFEHCISLVELEITRVSLLADTTRREPIKTNKSITKLTLISCRLQSSTMSAISIRLPSMAHLLIDNCVFTNSRNYDSNMDIEMPHTNFKSLYLKWSGRYNNIWERYKGFNAKVIFPFEDTKRDSIQGKWFAGGKYQIISSTFVKHRVAVLDRTSLIINISCKDISVFTIQVYGYSEINYRMKECSK